MKATVVKGDDKTLVFNVKDEDEVAINLTGATAITFKAATSLTATPAISLSLGSGVTLTTPATGVITVTLTDTITAALTPGEYLFELQITDASGNVSTVRDFEDNPGELTVLDDIT